MKTPKTTLLFLLLSTALFSCTADVLGKDATTPDKASEHLLLREWQQVIRYNCANEIVSDQVETVRAPNKYVSIVPNKTTNFYSAEIWNRTNNARIGGSYAFYIDMAPTLLNLKVEEGINQLNYKFKYCYDWKLGPDGKPTSECLKTPVLEEEGVLYIKVIYQQKWLSGSKTVKPTAEECKPKT